MQSNPASRWAALGQRLGVPKQAVSLNGHAPAPVAQPADVQLDVSLTSDNALVNTMARDAAAFWNDGQHANMLLVGPAGCGKTWRCAELARCLGTEFHSLSMSEGTDEVDLFGAHVPNISTGCREFVPSEFLVAYQTAGVFLLDEFDAGNANAVTKLNMALANGFVHAGGKRIARHKHFLVICAANTWGHGADRKYVGRNQLDAATLDRFAGLIYDVDYDERYERGLCKSCPILYELVQVCRTIGLEYSRVTSTRALKAAVALKADGRTVAEITARLTAGWSKDAVQKVIADVTSRVTRNPKLAEGCA